MTAETDQNRSGRKSLNFFIVLFVLALALNVFQFFRYMRPGHQLETDNAYLTELLAKRDLHIDSLNQKLNATIRELEERLVANQELAQQNEGMEQEIQDHLANLRAAQNEIAGLIASSQQQSGTESLRTLDEAEARIASLKEEKQGYLQDLEDLRFLYEAAQQAADRNSIAAQENQQQADSLQQTVDRMEQGLADAKVLRVSAFNITPLRDRRGVMEATQDAKRVKELRIQFRLAPSLLVESGDKTIDIRIIGTQNEVLSDHVESLSDPDQLISMSYETEYDGQEKLITLSYAQDSKYKKGKHRVELIHDGTLLDVREFTLF